MPQQLTLDDARQSLTAHIATKGAEIRAKFGPHIGFQELERLLADRDYTRYPVEIIFSATGLLDGEFAHPFPKGTNPEDGFTVHVHPYFATQLAYVPALVLYQLVLVNYGDFASPTDAEIFGAGVLGIGQEKYYEGLCEMADLVSEGIATAAPAVESSEGGCCGGGGGSCGCGGGGGH
ncbi:MAG: hypothetical protein JWQ83_543 [Lacunisphaera sp.]|nr:hypothetical protein [Lacunisphaera sp.]MDB6165403.1 hypothetical protein [Lacunisphaera sp.]